MDHNETARNFKRLLNREAEHAREMAAELEALVPLLSGEKTRQLAQLQIKASHKRARSGGES